MNNTARVLMWASIVPLVASALGCGGGAAESSLTPVASQAGVPADTVHTESLVAQGDDRTVQLAGHLYRKSYYSVGGAVAGLASGKSVVLRNNGGDSLTVGASGSFVFATKLPRTATYDVKVWTQPSGQTCTVSNGSGTIAYSNITNVSVSCVTALASTFSVGGNLTGLGGGKSVVLSNNGGDSITVSAGGAFTFPTKLANAAGYDVKVSTPPVGQTCTVSNGSGTISSTNVTNVGVACQGGSVWGDFTVTANTLTVIANEPLQVNSPFFGIEVRKNGMDITDDIVKVEQVTTTSWRYTFGTQVLNTPGASIGVSLDNRALATPGHYLALGSGKASTVQGLHQILVDCQAGVNECAGRGAFPGLLASVKGMSKRYMPRDIETAQNVYDFSSVFSDAAFLASRGMRLHVMFTVKSFGKPTLQNGTGTRVAFDIPRSASGTGGWDGARTREIHVYVRNSTGQYVETKAFTFNSTRTQVILDTPPPSGTGNVNVVYARDPFPEYAWQMTPPVGGWYHGVGGQNNEAAANGGSYGFAHAPWRSTTVNWMRKFMAAFRTQWTAAIANGLPDNAIESISIQESANALSETDPTYTVEGYRAGLFEYAKANARAVRGRGLHGQLMNIIPGGNRVEAMAALSRDIILWGGRLEGPDLFNNEPALENNVYENVHRAFHDTSLNMIWHQNASFSERRDSGVGYYTPLEQYIKAQRGVDDASTASGTRGLAAEYVFWNTTTVAPLGSPQTWFDALGTIAGNQTIQTSGNDRYLWKRASNGVPIGSQSLTKVNP